MSTCDRSSVSKVNLPLQLLPVQSCSEEAGHCMKRFCKTNDAEACLLVNFSILFLILKQNQPKYNKIKAFKLKKNP